MRKRQRQADDDPPLMSGHLEPSWRRLLDSRPEPSPLCTVVRAGSEGVELSIRVQRPSFLVPPLSWIIRPRRVRALRLDALGAFLWNLCDGRNRLETLVDRFAEVHALTFHESRVAVMHYVRLLMERGALIVRYPRPDSERREAP